MNRFDVIIVGAGAAGLMCAIEAGKRGRRTLVLDHAEKIAEKIRISGGGRCNFTNLHCAPDRYISSNPHFVRSALARYGQHDFIRMVERHGIPYHEKTLGQLFCDRSAGDIIEMLLKECADAGVAIKFPANIERVEKGDGFVLHTNQGIHGARSLVVACGGLSIPKIGASPFGYRIAEQFGHSIVPPRAGLVPLTFAPDILEQTKTLSGLSVSPARVSSENGAAFDEAVLFTHRGLSGPAVLQISSYWKPGETITVDMAPNVDLYERLKQRRTTHGTSQFHTVLEEFLPKRLVQRILEELSVSGRMGDIPDSSIKRVTERIRNWRVRPAGSEGYRTAEVTLGGVNTAELSSKTFESGRQEGLYFIGEVVDVTGHLGGFNFQWAWSSGWCAGQFV